VWFSDSGLSGARAATHAHGEGAHLRVATKGEEGTLVSVAGQLRRLDASTVTARTFRVLSVLGSRPEVIQAAPVSRVLQSRVHEVLVDTGQHYDHAMAEGQISDTGLPQPHYNLGVGSRPDLEQLAVGQRRIAEVIEKERPDAVIVRGDTNATLAGARAAVHAGLPLIHVEAGLRSYRGDMPEERNRVETDRLSDLLCAPTQSALDNLRREGVAGRAEVTGDVLYDMLLSTRNTVGTADEQRPYVLATVHRNYNTDDAIRLSAVLECLGAAPYRVIFPVHPRTRQRLDEWSLAIPKNVELRDPVTYRSMLALERDAVVIVTDSGGVQREAYMWGVPCITLREETEWVETVQTGWNVLAGVDSSRVRAAFAADRPRLRPPVFGNGDAAERIADAIVTYLAQSVERHVAV
jgi:UDP-GlcNAc3NAcA epimerase